MIVDVRHDLAQPDAWGETAVPHGSHPGRAVRAPRPRPVRAQDRHATAAIRCPIAASLRRDVRAARHRRERSRSSPTTRAAACTPRACGGCCAGSGTTPSPCSTAGSRSGRARAGRSRPTTPTSRADARSRRAASPRRVDAPALVASLATRSLLLVDARARERYRGDVEPLDPVAGHIPGALNRPYSDNLDADGTFKPAATLRAEFDALLAGRVAGRRRALLRVRRLRVPQPARDGASPGSRGARLYPGSWSEWCADPARPVARGDA